MTDARCLLDGSPVPDDPRYPDLVCAGCWERATDLAGRAVQLGSLSLSGGLSATHVDDGSTCAQVQGDGRVLVDEALCRAADARFGGVVVQLEDVPLDFDGF